MAEDSTSSTNDKPEDLPKLSSNLTDKEANDIKKAKEGEADTQQQSNSNSTSGQPFTIKTEKSKGWKRTEIISFVGMILSLFLFGMTLLTFKKTSRAIEISEASLMDARSKEAATTIRNKTADSLAAILFERNRVKDSIKSSMDSISLQSQLQSIKSSESASSRNIEMARKSLQIQIQSVEEVKRDFEIENQPILAITTLSVDTFRIGSPVIYKCLFKNLGKGVLKATEQCISMAFIGEKIMADFRKELPNNSPFEMSTSNNYFSDIEPMTLEEGTKIAEPVTKDLYNYIMTGAANMILYGRVIYINPLNKKKRKYTFFIRIDVLRNKANPFPTKKFRFLYNENEDIN